MIPKDIKAQLDQFKQQTAMKERLLKEYNDYYMNNHTPNQPTFAQWLAQRNQGMAKGGKAKFLEHSKEKGRMYHATHDDFNKFRANFRGAHFVTPDPQFANDFMNNSGHDEYEEGANIMPVHVNAQNPFDFQKLSHIKNLIRKSKEKNIPLDRDWKKGLINGEWDSLENEKIIKAIKSLGHDSFYVTEHTNDEIPVKNLGVFNPNQIKSAIGNRGTYDPNEEDITMADGGKVDSHEEAMERARLNAIRMLGLHEKNTPIDRANAMGYTVPAYHGTSKEEDFSEFKGNSSKEGQTFVALDPSEANVHAIGTRGSRVMPLLVKPGKMAPGISDWGSEDAYARIAKKHGRESFKVRDDYKSPVNLSILNNANIRSRFAVFDPERSHESNILAKDGGAVHLAIGGQGNNNWAKGDVERALHHLIPMDAASDSDVESWKAAMNDPLIQSNPHALDNATQSHRRALHSNAIQKWINGNLANYVRKQMATAKDPVRLLAEQGISHFREGALSDYADPVQAERHRKEFGAEALAKSDLAKEWENAADVTMYPEKVGYIREQAQKPDREYSVYGGLPSNQNFLSKEEAENHIKKMHIMASQPGMEAIAEELKKNPLKIHSYQTHPYKDLNEPWMEKADPNTNVFRSRYMDVIGFDHIIDVLKEDLEQGRIRPEQLNKISMEQAVRRVHQYDIEKQKAMNEAEIKNTEGMPVHKEYPEGYKWLELALPQGDASLDDLDKQLIQQGIESGNPISNEAIEKTKREKGFQRLADALKYEGDTMGHCVGGYCDDVASGRSRIFSLRDAKGEPHVTIETKPGFLDFNDWYGQQPTAFKALINSKKSEPGFNIYELPEYKKAQSEAPQRIVQIKGKQNKAPKPEYLPFVQDFVKSGNWNEVGDIRNAKMMDIRNKQNILKHLAENNIPHNNYLTEDEYKKHESDYLAKNLGLAKGGKVQFADTIDGMECELIHRSKGKNSLLPKKFKE